MYEQNKNCVHEDANLQKNLIPQENEINKGIIIRVTKIVHLLCITAIFAFFYVHFYGPSFASHNKDLFHCISVIFYMLAYAILARIYEAYNIGQRGKEDVTISHILTSVLLAIVMYAINTIAWWNYGGFPNFLYMIALIFVQLIVTMIMIDGVDRMYFKFNPAKKTILVYRDEKDLRRLSFLNNFTKHFDVVKKIQFKDDDYTNLLDQISCAEAVFIVGVEATERNAIIKFCADKKIDGFFFPHIGDVLMSGTKHVTQFGCPICTMDAGGTPEYFLIKRCFDIIMSAIAIIFLSWLMAIVAIAIKLYDGGPAIYKQVRLTKGGKEFNILKFRSMRVDAEKDGVARLAKENDDRITPIGKFIRKCRLDELPQLFNIFLGDMSIVGPRPERPEIAKQYEEVIPYFSLRLRVKAGLTGYAQVYGKYNTDPYEKLEMDLAYINQMTPLLDLKLIFSTVRILFDKESTSGVDEGSVTAILFDKINSI